MELAGLSVACAIAAVYPVGSNVFVIAGPGTVPRPHPIGGASSSLVKPPPSLAKTPPVHVFGAHLFV